MCIYILIYLLDALLGAGSLGLRPSHSMPHASRGLMLHLMLHLTSTLPHSGTHALHQNMTRLHAINFKDAVHMLSPIEIHIFKCNHFHATSKTNGTRNFRSSPSGMVKPSLFLYTLYTWRYMTPGRCPFSIFCSRGTLPRPFRSPEIWRGTTKRRTLSTMRDRNLYLKHYILNPDPWTDHHAPSRWRHVWSKIPPGIQAKGKSTWEGYFTHEKTPLGNPSP